AVDKAGGSRGNLGSVPHEYLQYSNECRILALDDLAEAGSTRISDSLGICLPPGIVVELRTLCDTASWFASAGASAGRRSGERILLFRWVVGCQQARWRGARPGTHSAARLAAWVACRDGGLYRGQRSISISRASGQGNV